MAKRRRRRRGSSCRRCGAKFDSLDKYAWGNAWKDGLCPGCVKERAQQRRAARGKKLLDQAKEIGTEERDGQTFKVVRLPPKR